MADVIRDKNGKIVPENDKGIRVDITNFIPITIKMLESNRNILLRIEELLKKLVELNKLLNKNKNA